MQKEDRNIYCQKVLSSDTTRAELKSAIQFHVPKSGERRILAYERNYDSKTGSFTVQTTGPSKIEDVYEMPFNADNVAKLYEKVEDDDCQFILEDLKTDEARSVSWSSMKDTLDVFCNKSFDYLWKADYMPAPVKAENSKRQ